MRNAIHKLCINLMSYAFLSRCLRSGRCIFGSIALIYRCVSGNCHIDKFICLVNSIRNRTFYKFLTVKSLHRNLGVSCHYYKISFFYILIGKDVLGSSGSSCLDFDVTILSRSGFFKSLRCHIGMCNTCRTRCYGKYFYGSFSRLVVICKPLVNALFLFVCPVYDIQKFVNCSGIAQACRKLLVHKHH